MARLTHHCTPSVRIDGWTGQTDPLATGRGEGTGRAGKCPPHKSSRHTLRALACSIDRVPCDAPAL